MRCRALLVLICIALGSHSEALGISWIEFSEYVPGALSQSGLQSIDGLELDVTFSNTQHMHSGLPAGDSVDIDDPAWPFANRAVSYLLVQSQSPYTLETTLSFAFTSPGGLPAGGSIGIVDLEFTSSSVRFIGYRDGLEVDVDWSVSFYQTDGVDVPDAIWDPATNTLRGSSSSGYPTENNFSFLVSDAELDSVVMLVTAANGDGIGFATSSTTVPNPDPVSDVRFAEVIYFAFLVTNPNAVQALDAFSLAHPRAIFGDGSPPDTSVALLSCRILDDSQVQIPPPPPLQWARLVGDSTALWFFQPIAPGGIAPPLGITLSVPTTVTPDSAGLQGVWFDLDYELFASGDVVTSGTVRFHCDSAQPTSVPEETDTLRRGRTSDWLDPTAPNPFNLSTVLTYRVRERRAVQVRIHDLGGRLVRTLVDDLRDPGTYRVRWDGTDQGERVVSSGTYFGVVEIGGRIETQKMMLVK